MMKQLCSDSRSIITGFVIKTPIGNYKVEACDQGLHNVSLCNIFSEKDFIPNTAMRVELETVDDKLTKPISQVVQWLQAYFEDPAALKSIITPALCFSSTGTTEFQRKVWNTLAATATFGKKLSYAELADNVGNPKASRAVGSAMKNNPVALIIPCHRVVRSDGQIGNYFSGAVVKDWLLSHESRHAAEFTTPPA